MATESRYELDFLESHQKCDKGELSIQNLAGILTRKLEELARWARVIEDEHNAQELERLVEQFDFIEGDTTATEDELDSVLEELYDWADGPVYDDNGNKMPGMILCRVRSTFSRNG